jgi:phage terminase large subunit-like protein
MSSSDMAAEKMGMIQEVFDRTKLQHFFPEVVPEPNTHKRTAHLFEIPHTKNVGEPSIKALGLASRIVGGHFDIIVADDIVDGQAEDSESQMEKATKWIKRSNPLFDNRAKGVRIVVGTYWPGGFYEGILDPDVKNYEKLVLGCFVDERYMELMQDVGIETELEIGDPIFPERETLEAIADAREDMGEWDFAHQMLNIRADDSLRYFDKDHIKYYKLSPEGNALIFTEKTDPAPQRILLRDLYRVITVDPATGEGKRTDESALIVCGHDKRGGRMFVLDTWHGRLLPSGLAEMILAYASKWHPHVIAPEDVAFQKSMKYFIKNLMNDRREHYNIIPVKPGNKSKVYRIIEAFQPFVRRGQVFFAPNQTALLNEMLNLQIIEGKRFAGKSPNMVDALAYQVDFFRMKTYDTMGSDEEDIAEDFAWQRVDKTPAYGLECET